MFSHFHFKILIFVAFLIIFGHFEVYSISKVVKVKENCKYLYCLILSAYVHEVITYVCLSGSLSVFFRLSGSLSDCLFVCLGLCLSACLDVWSYLWNLIRFASNFIKKHVRSTEIFWAQFNFLNWVILTLIGKTTGKAGFPS